MSKNTLLSLLAVAVLSSLGCTSRGIPLSRQIPELYPEFNKEDFIEIDANNSYLYYAKKLLAVKPAPSEFNELEYQARKTQSGFEYYVPKAVIRDFEGRQPASVVDLEEQGWLKSSQIDSDLILDYE